MGKSFTLRYGSKNGEQVARLSYRYHDLGGTDYEGIATLSVEEAMGLSGSGLYFSHGHEIPAGTPATRLSIRLRDDPQPNARLWVLSAQIEGRAVRQVGYLNCEHVMDLIEMGIRVDFPDGAPDWAEVDKLKARLEIQDLRDQAGKLLEKADKLEACLNEDIEAYRHEPDL